MKVWDLAVTMIILFKNPTTIQQYFTISRICIIWMYDVWQQSEYSLVSQNAIRLFYNAFDFFCKILKFDTLEGRIWGVYIKFKVWCIFNICHCCVVCNIMQLSTFCTMIKICGAFRMFKTWSTFSLWLGAVSYIVSFCLTNHYLKQCSLSLTINICINKENKIIFNILFPTVSQHC